MLSSTFKNAAIIGGVTAGLLANLDASADAHWNDHDEQVYDLSQHHDFIMNISLRDGGQRCCNGDDVFVDLQEIENPDGGYTVVLPKGTVLYRDSSGNAVATLDKETNIVIPPERILTAERAFEACKSLIKNGSKTCTAPKVNVLYAAPSGLDKPNPSSWCYWPVPKGF